MALYVDNQSVMYGLRKFSSRSPHLLAAFCAIFHTCAAQQLLNLKRTEEQREKDRQRCKNRTEEQREKDRQRRENCTENCQNFIPVALTP